MRKTKPIALGSEDPRDCAALRPGRSAGSSCDRSAVPGILPSVAKRRGLSQARTREILDAAKGDPNSMIGRNYAAYLDSATVEAKGLAPIQPWLNKIRAVEKPGR